MLIYLGHAWEARQRAGEPATLRDLYQAVMEGAVERVRPKMMTVPAIMSGLIPILWTSGTGASVMKRIAAPMVGGMVSSTVLTLVVISAIYVAVQGAATPAGSRRGGARRRQNAGSAAARCASGRHDEWAIAEPVSTP